MCVRALPFLSTDRLFVARMFLKDWKTERYKEIIKSGSVSNEFVSIILLGDRSLSMTDCGHQIWNGIVFRRWSQDQGF